MLKLNNNLKHNKIFFLSVIVSMSIFVFACAPMPKDIYPDVKMTQCVNPKPQVCTREYRPVCGFENDGNHKSFSNACEACANSEVTSYSDVDCGDLKSLSK